MLCAEITPFGGIYRHAHAATPTRKPPRSRKCSTSAAARGAASTSRTSTAWPISDPRCRSLGWSGCDLRSLLLSLRQHHHRHDRPAPELSRAASRPPSSRLRKPATRGQLEPLRQSARFPLETMASRACPRQVPPVRADLTAAAAAAHQTLTSTVRPPDRHQLAAGCVIRHFVAARNPTRSS